MLHSEFDKEQAFLSSNSGNNTLGVNSDTGCVLGKLLEYTKKNMSK